MPSSMIDHIHNEKKLLASKLMLELGTPTLQNKKKISKNASLTNSPTKTPSQNNSTQKCENDSLYREKLKLILQKHKDLFN
jgi:hypothetical protein